MYTSSMYIINSYT